MSCARAMAEAALSAKNGAHVDAEFAAFEKRLMKTVPKDDDKATDNKAPSAPRPFRPEQSRRARPSGSGKTRPGTAELIRAARIGLGAIDDVGEHERASGLTLKRKR